MENQLFIALRQNKLLKNVDISKINLDEVKGNLLTISEGEILYREGDKADTLYLVVSGEINIIKKRMLGKTKSYLFVENDFLGHDEFFEETSRTSTAVALRDSYLIALSKAETDYLIRLDEEVYINLHVPANEIDEETLNQRAELKITKDHEESKHKTFDESPSDIDDKTENQADEFFKSIADSSRVEEIKVIQPSEESKEEPETETKPPFEKEAIDFRDTSIFYEDGTPKSKFDLPSTENLPSEEIPMEKEKIPSSTREILDKDGIPKPEFEFTETSELQSEEKSSQGNLNDKIYQILNGGDASLPEIPESPHLPRLY